jgi:hypothetical protein
MAPASSGEGAARASASRWFGLAREPLGRLWKVLAEVGKGVEEEEEGEGKAEGEGFEACCYSGSSLG